MRFDYTDVRQTREWSLYMQQLGWQPVAIGPPVGGGWGYAKHLPIVGTVLKFPRLDVSIRWNAIRTVIARCNPSLVLIEPHITKQDIDETAFSRTLVRHGFVPTRHSSHPPITSLITLSASETTLVKNLRASTRTKVHKAQRLGVFIEESSDVAAFAHRWSAAAKRRGAWVGAEKQIMALWRAFRPTKKAILLLANVPIDRQEERLTSGSTYESIHKYKNASIAAGLFMLYGPCSAHYIYAFTASSGRTVPAAALLAWEALLRAKRDGLSVFDFEGTYREGSTPASWKGFSFFKQGFGGKEVVFSPGFYQTYRWAGLPVIRKLLSKVL